MGLQSHSTWVDSGTLHCATVEYIGVGLGASLAPWGGLKKTHVVQSRSEPKWKERWGHDWTADSYGGAVNTQAKT